MQHCALQALVTLLKALKGHAPVGDTPEWLLYQLRLVRTRPRLGSNAPPPFRWPSDSHGPQTFLLGGSLRALSSEVHPTSGFEEPSVLDFH